MSNQVIDVLLFQCLDLSPKIWNQVIASNSWDLQNSNVPFLQKCKSWQIIGNDAESPQHIASSLENIVPRIKHSFATKDLPGLLSRTSEIRTGHARIQSGGSATIVISEFFSIILLIHLKVSFDPERQAPDQEALLGPMLFERQTTSNPRDDSCLLQFFHEGSASDEILGQVRDEVGKLISALIPEEFGRKLNPRELSFGRKIVHSAVVSLRSLPEAQIESIIACDSYSDDKPSTPDSSRSLCGRLSVGWSFSVFADVHNDTAFASILSCLLLMQSSWHWCRHLESQAQFFGRRYFAHQQDENEWKKSTVMCEALSVRLHQYGVYQRSAYSRASPKEQNLLKSIEEAWQLEPMRQQIVSAMTELRTANDRALQILAHDYRVRQEVAIFVLAIAGIFNFLVVIREYASLVAEDASLVYGKSFYGIFRLPKEAITFMYVHMPEVLFVAAILLAGPTLLSIPSIKMRVSKVKRSIKRFFVFKRAS